MTRSPRLRTETGFSLTELMVTLTVLAAVVALLAGIMMSTHRTHQRTTTRAALQAASRQALSLMTTELRQAGADPRIPPAGIVGVMAADSTSVRIRADLNGDGAITTAEPSEDVTFAWDPVAKTLTRNPGSGEVAALERVTSLRFRYFDAASQPMTFLPLSAADRARVRTIAVTLTCEDRGSQPFTIDTRVTLRNQ